MGPNEVDVNNILPKSFHKNVLGSFLQTLTEERSLVLSHTEKGNLNL